MSSDVEITADMYTRIADIEEIRPKRHPVEKFLTLQAFLRHTEKLAVSRALKIADIGGSSGVYAFELADRGHEIHLRDIALGSLDIARAKQAQRNGNPLASIECGDAKD